MVQSGKQKVFAYFDRASFSRETKKIRDYPNKKWMIRGED